MPQCKRIFSEEHREKLSIAKRGKKRPLFSEEHRRKLSESKIGNTYTKGQHRSEESKKKMSEVQTKIALRGVDNPLYGKPISNETREKISKSNLGRKSPMEGKKHSIKTIVKMRKSASKRKAHPQSEKTRIKISMARRGENCNFYIDGRSYEPYCPKFNEPFKRRVRARYNNMCAECGKTREENGRELSVHHVNFDKQTCCKEGELVTYQKFVALCEFPCHNYATHHPEWAIEHYTKLVDEKYNGKSYLTDEEYISRVCV